MSRYPNCIIAGAPKSGTSSFFDYLICHPDVCGSYVKETGFFFDEDYILFENVKNKINWYNSGISGYLSYFPSCSSNASLVVEATPDYMYQNDIFGKIKELPDTPKMIFLLREPAERVYSLYQYASNNTASISTTGGFGEFLNMVRDGDDTLQNKSILRNSIKHGIYSDYLRKWVLALGEENILVLPFEGLKSNPVEFMDEVCRKLGLSLGYYTDFKFEKRNKSYSVKNKNMHGLFRSLYGMSGLSLRHGAFFKKLYEFLNTTSLPEKSSSDIEALNKLKQYYAPFNKVLEEEFYFNLKYWK